MVSQQTLVVGSVVLMATVAVVVPVVSAAPARTLGGVADDAIFAQESLQTTNDSQEGDRNATNGEAGNESALGNQMAAFMQSNAAQTEDTVENGMWEAAFERANSSERAWMARSRADQLNDRLAELGERNRTLSERYHDGSLSHEEYVSEASRLSGQIEALEDGVNGTARAAERAGLNVSTLDEVRSNAGAMRGPEVAGIARDLASGDRGPPADVPGRGPPGEDAERPQGPPTDAPAGPDADDANRTVAPGDGQGGPNGGTGGPDARGDSGNATRGPGAPGNGNGGTGQGDDAPGDGRPGDGDQANNGQGSDGSGNDGQGNDSQANDGEGSDGQGNRGQGNSSGGNGEGSNDQGSEGGNPDRGPAATLVTDILFTR